MKRALHAVIIKIISLISSQRSWEKIFLLSLRKMNYSGTDFTTSGELFVLRYIKNKLKQEPLITIFDVGANVGGYSKVLADLFHTQATIHSFEPSKEIFGLFLETTKHCSNIIANNLGLSDTAGQSLLFKIVEDSGLASLHERNEHIGGGVLQRNKPETVELSTIEAYCVEHKIERIHFLKLDVEGHELNVLKGAKDMINNGKIDFIQFEFGGCNIDSRTYFQDFYNLLQERYKIYRILKNGIYELPRYKETYEVFVTVNYLAIRK